MKLVIYLTARRKKILEVPNPFELGCLEFPTWGPDEFEEYGRTWAKFWPNDIIMLVEE